MTRTIRTLSSVVEHPLPSSLYPVDPVSGCDHLIPYPYDPKTNAYGKSCFTYWGTNHQEVIRDATEQLLAVGTPTSKRVIVMVTDGQPAPFFGTFPNGTTQGVVNPSTRVEGGQVKSGASPPFISGSLVDTIYSDYANCLTSTPNKALSRDTNDEGLTTSQGDTFERYRKLGQLSGIRVADYARSAGIQFLILGIGDPNDSYSKDNPFGDVLSDRFVKSPLLRRMANDMDGADEADDNSFPSDPNCPVMDYSDYNKSNPSKLFTGTSKSLCDKPNSSYSCPTSPNKGKYINANTTSSILPGLVDLAKTALKGRPRLTR